MPVPPHLHDDLRTAYESGNLVVFAGAGISAAAGLPDWKTLALRLRDRLQSGGAAAHVTAEIDELIQKGQLVDALSAISAHEGRRGRARLTKNCAGGRLAARGA
jgi:hypothetical protein